MHRLVLHHGRLAQSRPAPSPRALRGISLAALLALAACADPTGPTPSLRPVPPSVSSAAGGFEVRFTGIGTGEEKATIVPVGAEASVASVGAGDRLAGGTGTVTATAPGGRGLTVRVGALAFASAAVASGSYIYGPRSDPSSYRYVYGIFRVRNTTGASLQNPLLMATVLGTNAGGTAFTQLTLGNGTVLTGAGAASRALAMKPAGASHPGRTGVPVALRSDVLEIFPEAEVAAVGTTFGAGESPLPYGFAVLDTATDGRTLQPSASSDFPGIVYFAFKVPLDATSGLNDVFAFSFFIRPVTDAETRVTQSMEERDAASSGSVVSRVNTLGATAIHAFRGSVLDGLGTTMSFCGVRTAGTLIAPTAFVGTSCTSEFASFGVNATNFTVSVGGTAQFTGTPVAAGGFSPPMGVSYASANPAVATVSSTGLITGVAPGSTTIYTSPYAAGSLTLSATVTVNP